MSTETEPDPDPFSWVTDFMFDEELDNCASAGGVRHIPGVEELVREYYNNQVLDNLCKEHGRASDGSLPDIDEERRISDG